ncbi:MAG: glucose-6-phosphate isomerase [Alphaproteobacteria bacterium]|nr:glucose-6-phosphate isomerase [Alphaproteobacteria bacterium]MCL2889940.1 glucose-6-phosphate isomerase [Alphaproteobacteria bacterium]
MKNIEIFIDNSTVSPTVIDGYKARAENANRALHDGTDAGVEWLGWLNLPSVADEKLISDIESTAKNLREKCEVIVVIGIGGSYLGARAVIDAVSNSFLAPKIIYAGHNISEDYLAELLEFLAGKKFGVICISKSGTTIEPAIAFRLLSGAAVEIVCITDKSRGALRELCDRRGYKFFVIPDDVGGRFSVLTPVGLLPIAAAGFDIRKLIDGARAMEKICADAIFDKNPAMQYAAVRNALYDSGKKIEILVNYHPKLHSISEWWKQLFGESEGKEHKGIFPANLNFTTDLHSMGQWIQDGERSIFETVISITEPNSKLEIPIDANNLDGLNYIAGRRIDAVNKMAELGTLQAHIDGGVPNIKIEMPKLDEYYLGQLIYFFEKACGISGYMLGVNPFDQPGVEDYKKNMFRLLGN